MSAPIVEIRLSGVRMRIDRPQHPHADEEGRIEVEVRRAPRFWESRVEASYLGSVFWLTSDEIQSAIEALGERDRGMDARTI